MAFDYQRLPDSDPLACHKDPIGDAISFETLNYYGHESQGPLDICLLRFGDLEGQATVEWWTEDLSAKKDIHYHAKAGVITFEAGERRKVIHIEFVRLVLWTPTLEFKVCIGKCSKCHIGRERNYCRVSIMDDNPFPSAKYRESVSKARLEDVLSINPFFLYAELVKLIFNGAGVRWQTMLTLVLALSKQISTIVVIWCQMYLVNNVFGGSDHSRLLLATPLSTAYLIAFIYVAPMGLQHACGRLKPWMDLQGHVLLYIQTIVMRQYMTYSASSRQIVTEAKLQMSMIKDAEVIADGYVALLAVAEMVGGFATHITFILMKNPEALWCCVSMPFIMLVWTLCRETQSIHIHGSHGSWAALVDFIEGSCDYISLIADYQMRPKMSSLFAKRAATLRVSKLERMIYMTHSLFVLKWITPLYTAAWIVHEAPNVLAGSTSLGAFLATIALIKSLGTDILEGYEKFHDLTHCFRPLVRFTIYLNLEKDLETSLANVVGRCKVSHDLIEELLSDGSVSAGYVSDRLPILFKDVSIGSPQHVLSDVNLRLEQGKIYAVVGPHGSGKASFLRVIAMTDRVAGGMFFIPPHLRVLHVAAHPVILGLSCLDNLTFGIMSPDLSDLVKVEHVLENMRLPNLLSLVQPSIEAIRNDPSLVREQDFDSDPMWKTTLTTSEVHSLHLARAFITNPEVLVLQRPFAGFNVHKSELLLKCMERHVMCHGLAVAVNQTANLRPRTIFYTADSEPHCGAAEQILSLRALSMDSGTSQLYTVHRSAPFVVKSDDFASARSIIGTRGET